MRLGMMRRFFSWLKYGRLRKTNANPDMVKVR